MSETLKSEVHLWQRRANELADKLTEVRQQNRMYVEALQKIQHTGYADDAWVVLATQALNTR